MVVGRCSFRVRVTVNYNYNCKQRSVKKSVNVPMLPLGDPGLLFPVEIIRHGLVTCKNKIKKTFTHDMIMTSRPRSNNVLRFIIN